MSYVECKLDCSFCSADCQDFWDCINSLTLARHHFDHNPLLIHASKSTHPSPKPFRFHSTWLMDDSLKNLVTNAWTVQAVCNLMARVVNKLKSIKKAKQWNKSSFGDINIQIASAKVKLQQI